PRLSGHRSSPTLSLNPESRNCLCQTRQSAKPCCFLTSLLRYVLTSFFSRPVAFFVLLPRPARAWIIPPNFCPRAHRLRRFRLRRPRLILQILLLALVSPFHFARKVR